MSDLRWYWLALLGSMTVSAAASAGPFRADPAERFQRLNRDLAGHVFDFTENHGTDRRIPSEALCSRRDLYVYVPPGYDGTRPYPLMIWLHGFAQDERNFLDVIPYIDSGIRKGYFPAMVIAAPDGSITGRPNARSAGSFYVNSEAGRFEDYVIRDVYGFVRHHFRVRPEREAHVLSGASMGGFGAYNLGIKYRREFATVAGVFPPLNLRYADCRGDYSAPYDPNCTSLRPCYDPSARVARFYGLFPVRERHLLGPLFGNSPDPVADLARESPYEMLDAYRLAPGELNMYVGYGTEDEFNIHSQVESFVDAAVRRGLRITVQKVPGGRHDSATGIALLPGMGQFLMSRVGPYVP